MKYLKRYLSAEIASDLKEKMVFIGGPRQVGKTTLALHFLTPSYKENPAYLNWDVGSGCEPDPPGRAAPRSASCCI